MKIFTLSIDSVLLIKLVINLFFTNIDICKPKVIQGLDLVSTSIYQFFLEVRWYQQNNNIT